MSGTPVPTFASSLKAFPNALITGVTPPPTLSPRASARLSLGSLPSSPPGSLRPSSWPQWGSFGGGGMGKACTRPDGPLVSLGLSAPALHSCRNPFDSHSILPSCTRGMFGMLPRNQGGIPVGERSQCMAPGFWGGGVGMGPQPLSRSLLPGLGLCGRGEKLPARRPSTSGLPQG